MVAFACVRSIGLRLADDVTGRVSLLCRDASVVAAALKSASSTQY